MKFSKKIRLAVAMTIVTAAMVGCDPTSEDDTDSSNSYTGTICNLDKEAKALMEAGHRFSIDQTSANCQAYKKVYQAFVNKANGCKELTSSMKSLLEANKTIQSLDCNDL